MGAIFAACDRNISGIVCDKPPLKSQGDHDLGVEELLDDVPILFWMRKKWIIPPLETGSSGVKQSSSSVAKPRPLVFCLIVRTACGLHVVPNICYMY